MSTDMKSSGPESLSPEEKERAVAELIAIMQSWCEGDEADAKVQAESFERLEKALNARREAAAQAVWDAELRRRAAEIRNGTAKGQPAKEAIAELREKYSRNR